MNTEIEYLKGIAEAATSLSAWIEAYKRGAELRGIPFPEELARRNEALKFAINPDLPAEMDAKWEATP